LKDVIQARLVLILIMANRRKADGTVVEERLARFDLFDLSRQKARDG